MPIPVPFFPVFLGPIGFESVLTGGRGLYPGLRAGFTGIHPVLSGREAVFCRLKHGRPMCFHHVVIIPCFLTQAGEDHDSGTESDDEIEDPELPLAGEFRPFRYHSPPETHHFHYRTINISANICNCEQLTVCRSCLFSPMQSFLQHRSAITNFVFGFMTCARNTFAAFRPFH